jgi:hypothetical protein
MDQCGRSKIISINPEPAQNFLNVLDPDPDGFSELSDPVPDPAQNSILTPCQGISRAYDSFSNHLSGSLAGSGLKTLSLGSGRPDPAN